MKTLLRELKIEKPTKTGYPFSLPLFANGLHIKFNTPITFIVGENGSGKSTLLENLAKAIGFNTLGGNKNHSYENFSADNFSLSEYIKLSWSIKQNYGFFFRAETFFEFAKNLDDLANDFNTDLYNAYGGISLQKQSHGESFMSFFSNKINDGIYILDEPEAALSPEKQLSLISLLSDLALCGNNQFIIATHSPFLISVPNSTLYEIENGVLVERNYKDTKQFQLYKNFTSCPERYLKYLCTDIDQNSTKNKGK